MDLYKYNFYLKKIRTILLLSTVILIFLLKLNGHTGAQNASDPNYKVEWSKGAGQYPLNLTSNWFKSYTTVDGTVSTSTVSLKESQAVDGASPKDLVYVTIKSNVYQSNSECEIQLVVRRPISGQSVVTVNAYAPSPAGKTQVCSKELISAMAKVVEPDQDNTTQGPNRDSDPNTDTEQETQADIDAKAAADAKAANNEPTCEGGAGSTGWIVCPLIDGSLSLLGKLEENIKGQLRVDLDNIVAPEDASGKVISDNTSSLREGNGSLTIFANAAFAIGVLWIVVSQAITGGAGGGFFGAYEAKKVLPKLIAGVIAANFSWDLVNIMLKISNSLGDATKSIMLAPFSGISNGGVIEVGGWDGLLITGAGLGAVALAFFGFFAISPILIAAVVSIVVGYFALIFRKALIIGLVTFAPIALVISPFAPNITKKWFNLLRNMIFMYPIIMAMISIFSIMGYILNLSADAASNSLAGAVLKLAAIASFFAPYFMIVVLFKLMGDILGKIAGSVQAVGDKAGKSFGQKRLQGNQRAISRKAAADYRLKRKGNEAIIKSMRKASGEGGTITSKLPKRFGGDKVRSAQEGVWALRQGGTTKKGRSKYKSGLESQYNQVLENEGLEQLSYQAASNFDNSQEVTLISADGKESKGKLQSRNGLHQALAKGYKVKYKDVAGNHHELDGAEDSIRAAAIKTVASSGDVSAMSDLQSYDGTKGMKFEDGTSAELAGQTGLYNGITRKLAVANIGANASTYAAKAPGQLGIKPKDIAWGTGITGSDIAGFHGSEVGEMAAWQVASGDAEVQRAGRNAVLDSMVTNFNQAKLDKYNEVAGVEIISKEDIQRHTAERNRTSASASDSTPTPTPPSTPPPSTPPSTPPEPGTYRDNDGNTRQSGGPGGGGVIPG